MMRTTIDLPPGLHARVKRAAADRGESLSTTASALLAKGLESVDESSRLTRSPVTGLLQVDFGRVFTQEQVDELLDDDA